jgi:hypothetical protein
VDRGEITIAVDEDETLVRAKLLDTLRVLPFLATERHVAEAHVAVGVSPLPYGVLRYNKVHAPATPAPILANSGFTTGALSPRSEPNPNIRRKIPRSLQFSK